MPNVHGVTKKKHNYTKEMLDCLYRCMRDPIYFGEKFVYIVHPDRGRIKISVRDYQKRFISAIKENRKTVCLASRQIGKTTAVSIYILWYILFHDHKTVAVAANIDRTAKSILDDIRMMYDNLPEWMKIETIENNAHTMSFVNGSKVFSFATSAAGISGESVSFLYMDEVAKIDPPTLAFEFWKNNYPTISHGEKVVITSTPKGVGNLFHKIWKDSVDNRNGFVNVRMDWWECPEYNSEEWKEEQIRAMGIIGFNSEFGNQFIGSQATVIGPEALKNFTAEDPIKDTKVLGGYEKVWEEYDPKFSYLASADIALGSGNDYDTLQIFKIVWRQPNIDDYKEYEKRQEEVPEAIIEKLVQCFMFRSNVTNIPDFCDYTFRDVLPNWGDPYFIVENNGIAQSFVDKMTQEWYYENAYIHVDPKKKDNIMMFGINANKATKAKMVGKLKKFAEMGKLVIRDMDAINELMVFVEKKTTAGNRRFQAEEGSNDDIVIGIGWASFLADSMWMQDALTFSI